MVTNNVTVYQFEVGLDEVFADEVRFRVNVDCVIVVVYCSRECLWLFSGGTPSACCSRTVIR